LLSFSATRAQWPARKVLMFRRFTEALRAGLEARGSRSTSSITMESRPTAPCGTGTRQLLLLDDEEAILLPTAKYFRSLGWTVDLAREAEEGEALISHRHYDLAILDVRVTRFGGTGGLELLREIRRRDHGTSVIVLSAYMSTDMEAEARSLGAAAVLRKPQSLPDLAHLALTVMEGRRG
jgi:DNA-binding NtrC family response regulator